ncbi:MAG: hypothetical protein ACFCBU_02240 [Cyanophyceae cyanobacterium]
MAELSENDATKGIRQRQLCESFEMEYRDVVKTAKEKGLSTHEYVIQQTGWQLFEDLYYPPGQKLPAPRRENKAKGNG